MESNKLSRKNADKQPVQYVPPQSVEAEEALLSTILVNNDILLDVLEILTPEDFYKTAHQKIFATITDLFNESEPIDLITLANALEEKGMLDQVGGRSFLISLVEDVPLAANAQYYAKIVHEKSCLRRLIDRANAIAQRCYEDQGNVDDVVDFAEQCIFDISQSKINPSFHPLGKIIDDNINTLEDRQQNRTYITGVPTGFTKLDTYTAGFQKSDLIILAARPSMGKTAFALNIARNAAVEGNVPVAVFSLEMSKEQLSLRLLCAEASVDSSRLRSGYFSKEDWHRITDAAGLLQTIPIYIDDSANVSAMEIRAKARRLKMEADLGLIIIDYLQLMKSSRISERRDLEISEISRSLKALAKELEVPVVALSQLNRKLEERSDKRPQLSDLRESGALEQDADVVAFIYRDEVYNKDENNPNRGKAEIIIAKQRNGPVGTVHLTFLNAYTRFENPAPEYDV